MKLNEDVLRKIVRAILNENSKQGLTPAVQKRLDDIVKLFKEVYAARKKAGSPLNITGFVKSDWENYSKYGTNTTLTGLEKAIRDFYVDDIEWKSNVWAKTNAKDYARKANLERWREVIYPSVERQLDDIAKKYGWKTASPPGFIQYSKPTSVGISRSKRRETMPNNKMYMTFVKGSAENGFKEQRHNLSYLGKLLVALHQAPTKGVVAFKFDANLIQALTQNDNLIVYFDDPADKQVIDATVKSIPFILKDRSKRDETGIARNVFGKDDLPSDDPHARGSDSYVAAKQAVRNLFANANLILSSPNPSSIVLDILENISLNASHRA